MDLNAVPEIFFDILARVVPGIFLACLSCAVLTTPDGFFIIAEYIPKVKAWYGISAAIVLAYYVSIITGEICAFATCSFFRNRNVEISLKARKLLDGTVKEKASSLLRIVGEMTAAESIIGGVSIVLVALVVEAHLKMLSTCRSVYSILCLLILLSAFIRWHYRLYEYSNQIYNEPDK